MELAKRVRSRIRAWAAAASSQSVGSSTRAFNSSSLRKAGSQSKTPPEQFDRLLDVGLGGLDIQSHGKLQIADAPDSPGASIIQAVDIVLLRRRLRWRKRSDRRGGVGRTGETVLEDLIVGLSAKRGRVIDVCDLRLSSRTEGFADAPDHGEFRARWRLEIVCREIFVRFFHEVDEDRQRRDSASLTVAKAAVVIEPDVGADHDVGRKSYEPGRSELARGPGLAARRPSEH